MRTQPIKLGKVNKSLFKDKVMQLLPDGGNLNACLTCGACSSGCPATGLAGIDPRKFLRMASMGLDEEILKTEWVWNCTLCWRCLYVCPMKIDIPQLVWEVLLSAGGNNKEAWEWLLVNKKLPYMALLMNLRSMVKAGVDRKLVVDALMKGAERSRALPFRFIGAGNAAPEFAAELGEAMVKAIKGELPGKTAFIVDVSGSMDYHLSGKSQLNRIDAAGALGILLREVCEYAEIYTFSENLVQVPNYRGLALRDAIVHSQRHGGTFLKAALERPDVELVETVGGRVGAVHTGPDGGDGPVISGRDVGVDGAGGRWTRHRVAIRKCDLCRSTARWTSHSIRHDPSEGG